MSVIRRARSARMIGLAAVLAGTVAIVAVSLPSGAAAAAESEYTSSFTAQCVLGPGILNAAATVAITTKATGPSSVRNGEELTLRQSSLTLTAPTEISETFHFLSADEVRGSLVQFPATVTGGQPASLNLAEPASFPEGLPFEAPVEAGHPLTIVVPSKGATAPWPRVTVTGTTGQYVSATTSTTPGFLEVEPGEYRETGEGIELSISGYNNEGEKYIGPLRLVCNAPSEVILARVPIESRPMSTCTYTYTSLRPLVIEPDEGPASGGTTVRISGGASFSATGVEVGSTQVPSSGSGEGITFVTPPGSGTVLIKLIVPCPLKGGNEGTFTYRAPTETLSFKSWTLSGSLTPKPLGQAITLPSGSTFNGSGELTTATGSGSLTGSIAVPAFKTTAKLYGLIPVSLGMTVTQSGAISGTIAPSKTVPGDETLTLPVKLNLGFTSIGLLGLNIPTKCTTAQPVSLTLTDTLTREALISKGWSFSGTATVGKITCEGGLLGALYGETISGLVSGAGASYSLTVTAPVG